MPKERTHDGLKIVAYWSIKLEQVGKWMMIVPKYKYTTNIAV